MATRRTTPAFEVLPGFEFQEQSFIIKKKYKIGRFLKMLNDAPIDALEIILEEESYERFLDLEMDMDDLKSFLEELSKAMGGSDLKV